MIDTIPAWHAAAASNARHTNGTGAQTAPNKRLRALGCQQTPVVEVRLPDGIDRWSGHVPEKVKAAAWLATEGATA